MDWLTWVELVEWLTSIVLWLDALLLPWLR